MTADVFASLQALPNTQTLQTPAQQTISYGTLSLPGLFANLMNECIAEGEGAENPVQMLVIPESVSELQNISQPQMIAFTGNNSFPQSVMNILAGEAEITPDTPQAETMPIPEDDIPSPETADDDDTVIWPEDETVTEKSKAPKSPDVPEAPDAAEIPQAAEIPGTRAFSGDIKPAQTDDILPEVPEHEHADYTPLKVPAKIVKDSEEPEDSDDTEEARDTEETPDIPEGSVELAGFAGISTLQQQVAEHPESQYTQTPPKNSLTTAQPTRQRRVQPETQQVPHEQQEIPEPQEVSTNLREAFVNRKANPENSGQDSQQEPQNQKQSQSQNQSQSQPQTQSRKTEARGLKTEAVSQKPDTETRRTESHSDFGSYFEGILNSRRTTVRTSQPMPLSLRTAENFTQASALRDGLTNVVRFIRADGVQKARVIVDPPALGRVSVELTSGTSGVEASIKVASEQIRQLVQDQISQLRMNLSQQGVQVAEFTVDVQQDSSGNHNQQGQEQYAGRFGFVDDSDDDEAEDFRIDLEEGLLYWVA